MSLDINDLRRAVEEWSYLEVKEEGSLDALTVDANTASRIIQLYDAVTEDRKEKIVAMLKTHFGICRLSEFVWSL